MMYTTEQIIDNGLKVSYRFYPGRNNKTLFLFHGFAQTNALFELFIPSVLPYYSVIAIDLFFHGESTVETNSVKSISIERWNSLFNQIVVKYNIDHFSLLSYSMGSRFIVTLLQIYSSRINKIVFIAPDGFGNNFWFRAATSTALTRFLFKRTMKNPAWVRCAVKLFSAVGIINSITKYFIEKNLESKEHREKIYGSWVYFRKLTIPMEDFVGLVRAQKIHLMCFCGKEDQLVAKDSLQEICTQTAGRYIELDLAHHKMVQALEKPELIEFLISDR